MILSDAPHPAPITPAERALIEAFEATRGVTICPPCAFSRPAGEAVPLREALAGAIKLGRAKASAASAATRLKRSREPRDIALALKAEGLTSAEIAKRMGLGLSTIEQYMTQAGWFQK